jgi:hypothetical protein
MGLFARKSKVEETRRRPAEGGGRAKQYSYYARQQAAAATTDANRARRQPLPRSKREILRFVGERFGVVLALLAGLALLVTSVQVSMNPRLVIVNDTAVYRLHPDDTYKANISRTLRSSWTNTNKITIDTTKVATELKRTYPEVADASVALPVLGQRPMVYIQLTKPSLVLVSADGTASVLDEKGRVLAPASQVTNLDSFGLPTITDESGLISKPGELVLSSGAVNFIQTVLFELHSAGVNYSKLVLPPSSQELDVYITGQTYYAKFNLHSDTTAREQAGAYVATVTYLQKQGKVPTAYVDVRLSGRTYYK